MFAFQRLQRSRQAFSTMRAAHRIASSLGTALTGDDRNFKGLGLRDAHDQRGQRFMLTHPLGRRSRPLFAALASLAVGVLAWSAVVEAAASQPPALYTDAQASQGASLYASKCAICHGAQLEGGAGPPLTGPNITTLGEKTHLSVGDMFTYITSNMPLNAPGSLSKDEYVKIMAYILKDNGYPAGSKPLTYSSATGVKVMVRSYK